MSSGEFDVARARFENETLKEWNRRLKEYIAMGFIGVVILGCIVAIASPLTTTTNQDGKTTTVSGADESTKSWAKTTITVIVGAAIGYALKQTPKRDEV